jgi:hypothetical protein
MLRANNERPAHERQEFGFLIRCALNDACMSEKSHRRMYASLIGSVFGRRAHARRKRPRVVRKARESGERASLTRYDVVANAGGQLEWKL